MHTLTRAKKAFLALGVAAGIVLTGAAPAQAWSAYYSYNHFLSCHADHITFLVRAAQDRSIHIGPNPCAMDATGKYRLYVAG